MSVLTSWLSRIFYVLAQGALLAGRPGRFFARAWLRQSLALSPHDERARGYLDYLQGLSAMEGGDPDEAVRLLRRAAKALPRDPAVQLDAGVALAISGEWQAAESALGRLLQEQGKRVEGEPQLWFALGWSQLRLGRAAQAVETVRRAAALGLGTPELRLLAVLAKFAATGSLDQEALARLLRTRPRLLPTLLQFIEQVAEEGKTSRAEELLSALPAGTLPPTLRLLAASALHANLPHAAQWALQKWEANGQQPSARLVLQSELHLRKGELGPAVTAARQALAAGPNQALAEEQLGEALLLAGNREEAFAHLTEAVALGSPSALAAGYVALRLVEEGRHKEARALFRVQRTGTELGCALADAASAWLVMADGNLPKGLALATRAWQEYRRVPQWANTAVVAELMTSNLLRLLETGIASAEKSGREELLGQARKLRRDILQSRSTGG